MHVAELIPKYPKNDIKNDTTVGIKNIVARYNILFIAILTFADILLSFPAIIFLAKSILVNNIAIAGII